MSYTAAALILAAGLGRRMGQDKALLELDGKTALERAVAATLDGGCARVVIVRAEGKAPVPEPVRRDPRAAVVTVGAGLDMVHSVRAAAAAVPVDCAGALVLPVDHALVRTSTVAALLGMLATRPERIVLPRFAGSVGHPIGLPVAVLSEAH